MTDVFWDNVLLFKAMYDQALDPVAQRWKLTRMELDLLLFLANNPAHNTAAEAVRLRQWTKSHVSAAVHSLQSKNLLSAEHPKGNRKTLLLFPLPTAGESIRDGQAAQRFFYQTMLQGFTQEEELLLADIAVKIARNIRAAMKK